LWRVALYRSARAATVALTALGGRLSATAQSALSRLQSFAMRHFSTADGKERSGVFARTWAIGGTALWIAVLLTAYVLVYYF
jgi:multicomponent Na+:H+ antiporter subunit D